MNQQVADTVRSLPPILQDTWILGCFYLVLSALAYLYFIRPALWRYIRANASPKVISTYLPRRRNRLLFTSIRKKAHLEHCGWYTVNLYLLPALITVTLSHLLASVLHWCAVALPTAVTGLLVALLTLLFFTVAVLSLISQPAATKERRTRWGFRPLGNAIHALLWQLIIVAALFLWFYVAYFLGLL